MIARVSFEKTLYNEVPFKFEAGTPNIEGAIGLGVAIDYLMKIGMKEIAAYESELVRETVRALSEIPEIKILGQARERAGLVSFLAGNIHPHDIGTFLDREGIAIRAGHHCAMPLMHFYGVPATCRASFSFYNTKEEIALLSRALKKSILYFKGAVAHV